MSKKSKNISKKNNNKPLIITTIVFSLCLLGIFGLNFIADGSITSATKESQQQAELLKMSHIVGFVVVILYLLVFLLSFRKKLQTGKDSTNSSFEMKEIMETVNEGLFLIDSDLKVSGQYSACLEKLIGQHLIADRRLDDLLKPIVAHKDLVNTQDFIEQLFNDRVKERLIQDLNPLDRLAVQITDEDGRFDSKYLSFTFSRIYENTKITRVLVGVRDITKSILLEQQLSQQEENSNQQMELLTSIMHADPQMLHTFINHAHNTTERINDILKRSENEKSDLRIKTKDIYREVHSLKGEASALEFNEFVELTHSFENDIEKLQRIPNLSGNDFLSLTINLQKIITQLNRLDKLVSHITQLSDKTHIPEEDEIGLTANQQDQSSSIPDGEDALSNYFRKYITNIANRNSKLVELHTTGFNTLEKELALSEKLTDIIVQLLRNAVVHGIETPEERRELGKNETGIIQASFEISKQHNRMALIVTDDGAGVQFSKVRQKLVEIGVCDITVAKSLEKEQLVALLFDSGFSTMKNVNEDAGRGMGLDIIKDRIENLLGGSIHIETKASHHTSFIIYFPISPEGEG